MISGARARRYNPGFTLPEQLAIQPPKLNPANPTTDWPPLLGTPAMIMGWPRQFLATLRGAVAPPGPGVCAIPLLSALPANPKAQYKIQIVAPPRADAVDRMPQVRPMPVCGQRK